MTAKLLRPVVAEYITRSGFTTFPAKVLVVSEPFWDVVVVTARNEYECIAATVFSTEATVSAALGADEVVGSGRFDGAVDPVGRGALDDVVNPVGVAAARCGWLWEQALRAIEVASPSRATRRRIVI